MLARENPFRTETVLSYRYVFHDGQSLESLTKDFNRLNRRAAIVGPKGHGKTTLAEDLEHAWLDRGEDVVLLRLTTEDHARDAIATVDAVLESVSRSTTLILDGAEQLGWFSWRRVLRRASLLNGLLITVHKAGRLPTLRECQTNPTLLADIVQAVAPNESLTLLPRIEPLFDQHSGNIRQCLRSLYDVCAASGSASADRRPGPETL